MYVILADEKLEELHKEKLRAEARYTALLDKKNASEAQRETTREEAGEAGRLLHEATNFFEQCARNVGTVRREVAREILRLLQRRDAIAELSIEHERTMRQAHQQGDVAAAAWHRLCAEMALQVGHYHTQQLQAAKRRTREAIDVNDEAARALSRARRAFFEARARHTSSVELNEATMQRFSVAEVVRRKARRAYNDYLKIVERRKRERTKKLARWAGVPERYLHTTHLVEDGGTTMHFYFGPTVKIDRRMRPDHGHIVVKGNAVVYRRLPGQKRSQRHGNTVILLPKLK